MPLSDEILDCCPSTADELENQRDHSQYQQNMNEPTERVAGHHSQQPQHQQNYEDCPKHRLTSITLLSVLATGVAQTYFYFEARWQGDGCL
jgi:hypothetical protein